MTPHEKHVQQQLEAEGWQTLRQGWPDWICFKTTEDGRIVDVKFVEAKADGARISPEQATVFALFNHLGISVEIRRDAAFYKKFYAEKYDEWVAQGCPFTGDSGVIVTPTPATNEPK